MDDVRYAVSAETHVAYRVFGEPGRVDVVMVAGALFPFELLAENRVASRFMDGLAALGRLVVFDKRGVGLSDPMTDWVRPARAQWAEDLCAVVEAASLDRPLVVSWEPFGVARLAVENRPELFGSMALVNPLPFTSPLADQMSDEDGYTVPTRSLEEQAFPSGIDDEDFNDWLQRAGRTGASPAMAPRIWAHLLGVSDPLTPANLDIPTLVLHNRDYMGRGNDVRSVAEEIPNSRFAQVDGADAYPIAGDVDPLIDEISRFVTGSATRLAPARTISVLLFTDLVDSTQRAVDEGDARWRGLLDAHDRAVQRCIGHHGGRVVKYTGDGVLALMPSASGALEAVQSIRDQLDQYALEIRAGIHIGDIDVRGDDVSGIAVNVAARIMGRAEGGETLVTEAVRQSTLGSAFRFRDCGIAQLKGVPGEWLLYRSAE